MKIAIDGPAGAGKSTVSRAAAEKLGFVHIDTGAMYRSVTVAALKTNTDLENEDALANLTKTLDISFGSPINGIQNVYLNGEDVTKAIREPEINVAVSPVARAGKVRALLVEMQRKMAESINVLMDGRDIGTVVLPNAELKVYLTATVEERARRRQKDFEAAGKHIDLKTIEADLAQRDHNDMSRTVGPLKQADDAIYLDTSDMSFDEVVNKIVELTNERMK